MANQITDLDPKDFKMKDYDNVRITMPAKPVMTEEDIDAQLFGYALSTNKKLGSLTELDDDWVKANFDGLDTIEEVRQAIKDQYDHDMEFETADIKYRACCDALIERVEGTIPQDLVDANVEVMFKGNEARLAEMHISLDQYLREEHLTRDQYDEKVRKETLYQMKLNLALDMMVEVLCMQVGNHEICDYLSTPDPKAFLEELRETGQVEAARKAAVRVKAMRRVIDTAIVTVEGEEEQPAQPVAPVVEDDDDDFVMPDLENLPRPTIRNKDNWSVKVVE